jgi:chaperonin GroES
MTIKLKPLGDRVIVRPLEEDTTTASGIIIPDTAKEKPQKGVVLAVGPGARDEDGNLSSIDLKENDIVIFGKFSGNKIKVDGEDILFLSSDEILAKIKPNKKVLKLRK